MKRQLDFGDEPSLKKAKPGDESKDEKVAPPALFDFNMPVFGELSLPAFKTKFVKGLRGDIIIKSQGTEFYCSEFILCQESEVLRERIQQGWFKERKERIIEISADPMALEQALSIMHHMPWSYNDNLPEIYSLLSGWKCKRAMGLVSNVMLNHPSEEFLDLLCATDSNPTKMIEKLIDLKCQFMQIKNPNTFVWVTKMLVRRFL